jgi:REP element-mobilizing transposase RayT
MALTRRTRGYLPHWEAEGGTYFVTFHLGDSLPSTVLAKLTRQRKMLEAVVRSGRQLTPIESVRALQLRRKELERYLDANHGECILRRAECAAIVAERLAFRDGNPYELLAWVVMPNHAHALFRPAAGHDLAEILGAWKSVSTRLINAIQNRRGVLWQREYYDHLIRDEAEFIHAVEYILDNPRRAGLRDWPWVYVKGR